MNPQELQEAAPAAQTEVALAWQYNMERDKANDAATQLTARLDSVVGFLQDVQAEFGLPFEKVTIQLSRVEATTDPETGATNPAGTVEVCIKALKKSSTSSTKPFIETDTTHKNEMVGFNLCFAFRPDLPADSREHIAAIGEESTIRPEDKKYNSVLRGTRDGIEEFHGWATYTPQKAIDLHTYIDKFLPSTTARVTDLEGSIELIKTAMANPELNPQIKELRDKGMTATQWAEELERKGAEEMAALEAQRREDAIEFLAGQKLLDPKIEKQRTKDRDDAPNGRRHGFGRRRSSSRNQ